jgi:hypothetical protein
MVRRTDGAMEGAVRIMTSNKPTCCICFLAYEGRGHSARPVNDGFCCDECNRLVVRIRLHQTRDLYPVREEK